MSASNSSTLSRREIWIGIALLVVLWLTRVRWLASDDHFGAGLSLPDASWALFFLAGALTTRLWWPALLLASAGALDYIALRNGVSDYCITPAYVFLIPTYLALWGTGRWSALDLGLSVRQLLRATFALGVGVLAAFLISNTSFYYFAGYFDGMSALAFVDAVARYLPHYLFTTALYCGVACLTAYVWRGWRSLVEHENDHERTKR